MNHIVYILSDEHFGGAMSHMGDPNVRTPNMDRMAEEGASFSRAYANCPICTPSRGTIFSGRHAHAGPVQSFFDVYKASSPSTATILRSAGYHTAYFGKWHCGIVRDQLSTTVTENVSPHGGSNRTPEYHRGGFQDWYAFEYNNEQFGGRYYHQDEVEPRKLDGYQTDVLTDMTLDYLDKYDRDEPLFLVLSVEPPHFPLEAPESFLRFDPASLEVRPNFADSPEMRERLAIYYAMVENLDWNLGRVLEKLQSLSTFKDDTLTVYFSDHGDHMGSHGLIERKEHIHEEASRIPSIFHFPGRIPAQGCVDGLFSLVDLMATTLGLSGVDIPSHNQGTDFSPALRGEAFTGPDVILVEMCGSPRWNLDFVDWRGLVSERWKYAYYETGHELLFDLHEDPYELVNLADTRPDICDQMKTLLLHCLAETREPYFDVLIKDGVKPDRPALNIAWKWKTGVFPGWDDMIENAPDPNS
jgi:arylsulfatase A-like enzyme